MPISSRLVLVAALSSFALIPEASAQDPDPRLPSLTPREFEIRGDVRVDLPQIERQPLSGFGPPPRTYVVPADRVAITGAYDPSLDALPPLTLAAPVEPPSDLPTARYVRAEGTYGNEAARTGRLDLSAPVASGQFTADVDYEGVGSTSTLDEVSDDRLTADAIIRTGGAVPLGIGASVLVDRYAMPGVENLPTNIPNPLRRLTRLGARAEVGLPDASPFEGRVRFVSDRLAPATDGAGPLIGESQSGSLLDATARLTLRNRIRLDGGIGAIGLDEGVGQDARFAAGGGSVLFTARNGTELLIGARGLLYEVGSLNGNGDARAVSPIVDLSIPVGTSLRLFGSNDPRLVVRGLGDMAEANPFIVDRPVVAPDLLLVDARVGAEIVSGGITLRGFAHYTDAPTYLFFQRAPDGRFVEVYESVRLQGVTGEAAWVLPGGISVDAGATFRETELVEGGGEIPFVAPLVFRGGIQIPFSRGRLSATVYREGERPVGAAQDIDGFTLVSADARLDLTSQIALLVQADRLVGSVEQWPGYPLPGTAVRGGLRVTL
ncbi:MAG: hypothetical protein AAGI52_18580 [Bacteroidota bacterium]